MNWQENWIYYIGIALFVGFFFFLYAVGLRGFGFFVRMSLTKSEQEKILLSLRRYFSFSQNRDLVDIQIKGVDFPSKCCGGPILRILPRFREEDASGKKEFFGKEILLCRKCLKRADD